MNGVLVDSNVILDITNEDSEWFDWSARALEHESATSRFFINPIIYDELSVQFDSIVELDAALPTWCTRQNLPYEAAFFAGKAFLAYKRRGGVRTSPLPDFYIGAHALVAGYKLLTRDAKRYRTYFPDVELIAPD